MILWNSVYSIAPIIQTNNKNYLKENSVNFDRPDTFLFVVSSNLLQQKSPTLEIIGIFSRNDGSEKIHAKKFPLLGSKFEETTNKKVSGLSKLTEFYFNIRLSKIA